MFESISAFLGSFGEKLWPSLPDFGTAVLYAVLVAAAYSFSLSVLAGRGGSPRLLHAARWGAYGTVALVGLGVLVLAYAFVTHDFRLSYVARYSDRSMATPFLIAALWGGQDGSLLWWLFLTSLFSGACVLWLKRRYLELQPYVIATLMCVIMFFSVLMLFAANPFATSAGGAPLEGNGLNFQLRNFYMIIHPPSLYVGFTSAAVPFGFAIAALITGRLDNDWIVASRKWMLFSWLFLSIGNALGMLWAYEELGWGGPWAWDPVENAAFLPWLTASAYLHSIMLQERKGMFKVWNIVLICLTFFLTIFGTFLTRSGLIASVHSFAQSGIGDYFLYFMGVIAATCISLIVYRLPKLKSEDDFDAVLSREVAFLANNWGFLSLMVFIAVATIWPRISEGLLNEKSTLGPTFYNLWIPPLALLLLLAMGVAPLLGWRKTSRALFIRGFRYPVGIAVVFSALHIIFGKALGYRAFVDVDSIYPGSFGSSLASMASTYTFFIPMLCCFNIVVVIQEFSRGIAARRSTTKESIPVALFHMVRKKRRQYGGYLVHVGIAVMFLGFAGRSWGIDKEISLSPGERTTIGEYELSYVGPRMEVDTEKRMIFADLDVKRHGEDIGRLSPAKFIYKTGGDAPSTEVAKHITLRNDLYVIIGMINPQTKIAAFQMHVNTLISFIWLGAGILVLASLISLWPEVRIDEVGVFAYIRAIGSVAASLALGLLLAAGPAVAYGSIDSPLLRKAGAIEPSLIAPEPSPLGAP